MWERCGLQLQTVLSDTFMRTTSFPPGSRGGGENASKDHRLDQLGDKTFPASPFLGQRHQTWAHVTQVSFLQLHLAFSVDLIFLLENWQRRMKCINWGGNRVGN